MSRCFPYPPPGCALTKAALIESIKFQNESGKSVGHKEKSKEQKKEKRREKKERKEKKNETRQSTDKPLVKAHFGEKHWSFTKAKLQSVAEPEQLERSSVTEEYGEPAGLVAPSTSSDSTENDSNKRKRQSSPADVTRGHGKIIRLRIPLKKPKIEEQPCSTSGRTNIPSQTDNFLCSSIRNDRDQICSISQPIENAKISKPLMFEAVKTPMQRAELQYTNLMDSLVQPQPLDDADDLDWLLKGKRRDSCVEKKLVSGNDGMACSLNWGLWPRAQYLREVDLYALPYTIPF